MKLALQGHTIVVSSGDYGVAGNPIFAPKGFSLDCTSSAHRYKVHKPMTPSTCPYVTSVGGTRLYEGQSVYDPESVMEVNFTAEVEGFVYPGFHTAFEYFSSGAYILNTHRGRAMECSVYQKARWRFQQLFFEAVVPRTSRIAISFGTRHFTVLCSEREGHQYWSRWSLQ